MAPLDVDCPDSIAMAQSGQNFCSLARLSTGQHAHP